MTAKIQEVSRQQRNENETLHNLCTILYIIKVIKSSRMRSVGYVAQRETQE